MKQPSVSIHQDKPCHLMSIVLVECERSATLHQVAGLLRRLITSHETIHMVLVHINLSCRVVEFERAVMASHADIIAMRSKTARNTTPKPPTGRSEKSQCCKGVGSLFIPPPSFGPRTSHPTCRCANHRAADACLVAQCPAVGQDTAVNESFRASIHVIF